MLIASSLFSTLFIVIYLYNNYRLTGFLTGAPRVPAVESNVQLVVMLIKAFIIESSFTVHGIYHSIFKKLLLPSILLQIALLIYILIPLKSSLKIKNFLNIPLFSKISFTIGIIYTASLFYLRSQSHFNNFDYRLLSPLTLTIILGILMMFISNTNNSNTTNIKVKKRLKISLLLISAFSIINTLFVYNHEVFAGRQLSYIQNTPSIIKKYDNIYPNSLIAFGSEEIKYLRDDNIYTSIPYYKPQIETWDEYLLRLKKSPFENIYIELNNLDYHQVIYHQSIYDSLEVFRKRHGEFYHLR